MISEDMIFIKSVSTLRYLGRLFSGQVIVNFVTLEITFTGSWRKVKKAARFLNNKRIWYKIDWVHTGGSARPQNIIIEFDKVSLRR